MDGNGRKEKWICGLLDKGMLSLKGRIKKEYTTHEIKGSKGEEERGKWGEGLQ